MFKKNNVKNESKGSKKKVSLVENAKFTFNIKQAVKKAVLDVEISNNDKKANVVAYFVDKKGLKSALKSDFGEHLKSETEFNEFEAKNGDVANIGFIGGKKVIFIGVEDEKKNDNKNNTHLKNDELKFQKLGAKVADYVAGGVDTVVAFSDKYVSMDEKLLVDAYFGFNQKIYRFNKYLTDEKTLKKQPKVKQVVLYISNAEKIKKDSSIKALIEIRKNQLEGIFCVREFGNEPANVLYPESFANEIKNIFEGVKNTKVKILSKTELEKLGMNMLLGVAKGSANEPKVVIVEYNGNTKKSGYDLALIGKGVCFDSGGLCIKPSQYMDGMKGDMLGAATVLSSTLAIAKNSMKVNVVAVAGLVENMPGCNAQKVGDIVKSMSGKTVEIIDTDAEGRLVLGDILYYAQTKYKPEYMIDMATLTGAIIIALGTERSGVFTNSDALGKKLYESGKITGDECFIMPLEDEYREDIKSQIADIRNLGKTPRSAGSATAAAFLESFIDDNKNWAHIDIAGVDNATSKNAFCVADFVSGYGVKLINTFVEKNLIK